MEVWNVAHMEELGAARHFELALGVGLLSPFMSSENQQWELEVSAVINRVTEDVIGSAASASASCSYLV